MNLKRRGMDIDTRCDVCYRFDEDGAHLFFKCKITEERWDTLGLSRKRDIFLSKRSAKEVIEALMSMKEEVRVKCCYTLWMCWSELNRIREGESRRSACWLAHSILFQIEERKKTIVQKISSSNDRISKWEKPEAGFVKVNCDTAFDGTSGNVG